MKLYLKCLSMHLKSRMAYKRSFFFSILGNFLVSFTSFLWMYFLLDRFGSVAGYTLGECLLSAGVILTSFSLAECFFRGFDSFGVIVREARLDRMLLRPRGLVMQVLCERIELSRVGRLVQGLFMLVWGVRLAPVPFTAYHYLVLTLMSVCGAALFSALFVIYAAICFFTLEGLEFMNVFTDGAREYGAYPLDVYGRGALKFCTYVIPYALFQYYPLMYLIGRTDNWAWGLLPLAAPLFLVPAWLLWRVGVRKYTSAGS